MNTLYKQKYGIGIYKKIRRDGDTDELVELCESAHEFAKFIGRSINQAYCILGNHFSRKQKDICINNKVYEMAFIDLTD